MRTTRSIILAFMMPLLVVFGCTKENGAVTETETKITQPEGFLEFYYAYATGSQYTSITVTADSIAVEFTGGSVDRACMSIKHITVDDCTNANAKTCAVDDDACWMVAGVPTGIKRDYTLQDAQSIPFYIHYTDGGDLKIKISNGNELVYTYLNPAFLGNLPKVYLVTDDGKAVTSKEEYKTGKITIKDPDHKFWNRDVFESTMKIRGRGNSTWGMPKKPYKIKLDSKARLFDMSNDKEWCLLANYCDKSLMRNLVAMELSRRLGFSWTPQMVPVDVYFNGNYAGVYCFCEHKKVSSERVNINLDAGDMYFELEQQQDATVCWWTDHGAPVMFDEPEEPTDEQILEAKNFFASFESELWKGNFETVYKKYIDMDSFINYYIIQELTKNCDGNLRKSTFLTLPKGGKLEMYHVWDFDISMGNCDYYGDGVEPWQGWWIKDQGASGRGHGWYYHLFMDPNFVDAVQARWKEVHPLLVTIPEWIADEQKVMGGSVDHNFQRWAILNSYVWPNYKVTGSYQGEVDWLLEAYNKRLAWLDANIPAL